MHDDDCERDVWQPYCGCELRRELAAARAELERAMRVVEAAQAFATNDPPKVADALREWEDGR